MRWQYGQTGKADRDKQRQGLAVLGVPPEQIEAMLPAKPQQGLSLLPLAVPVWQVWQDMDTQWRVCDGVIQGLELTALAVVHRQRATPLREQRAMWPLLRAMEREALACIRKK